jgi:prefoldin subunit 5
MTEYKMPEMVEIDEAIEQLNNAIAKLTEATKKVEDDK